MEFIACIFGLVWGSFLNVLADRLPRGENVLWGRSHCDYCKRDLRWYELIPLLSFLLQRGRCLRCKRKLAWQYPLSELVTGIGFFGIAAANANSIPTIVAECIVFSSFLVIFISDVKYQIIPDSMVVGCGVGSLLYLWVAVPSSQNVGHGAAAIVSFLLFYALWLVTKKRGIGFGDVKLSFVLGVLLGYPETILALYVAFLTGAAVGVILILVGNKTLKSKIAFGPFLVFGSVATLIFHSFFLTIWKGIF